MLERSLLTILSIDSSDDVAREWQFYSMEWIYQFFDQWIITILFQKNTGKPTYQSDARNGKHKDIVWQVKYDDHGDNGGCGDDGDDYEAEGVFPRWSGPQTTWMVILTSTLFREMEGFYLVHVNNIGPFKNHLGFLRRVSIINVSIIPGWPTGLSWRQHFGRYLEMIENWWWINFGQISHNIWHIAIVYFFVKSGLCMKYSWAIHIFTKPSDIQYDGMKILRFNDTLLINFCKSLQNLGEESVGELLMGEFFC